MLELLLLALLGSAIFGPSPSGSDDDEPDRTASEDTAEDAPNLLEQIGTDGDDTLIGTDGDDALYGLGGDDVLQGGAGDDLLDLGEGPQSGNDLLDRGDDPGPDSDFISIAEGGAGDDTLFGGSGFERLLGGDGDDELHLVGSYVLNDTDPFAGAESELAQGGNGADTIFVEDGGLQSLFGVWVDLSETDAPAQDIVVVEDSDAQITITGFDLGTDQDATSDILDLSALTTPDGADITADDIEVTTNPSSGPLVNAFLTVPNGPDGNSLEIRLLNLDPGDTELTNADILARIGIPA